MSPTLLDDLRQRQARKRTDTTATLWDDLQRRAEMKRIAGQNVLRPLVSSRPDATPLEPWQEEYLAREETRAAEFGPIGGEGELPTGRPDLSYPSEVPVREKTDEEIWREWQDLQARQKREQEIAIEAEAWGPPRGEPPLPKGITEEEKPPEKEPWKEALLAEGVRRAQELGLAEGPGPTEEDELASLDPYELSRRIELIKQGKIGVAEYKRRQGWRGVLSAIPFLGMAAEGGRLARVYGSAKYLAKFPQEDGPGWQYLPLSDQQRIRKNREKASRIVESYLDKKMEEELRGFTIAAKAVSGIETSAAWMGEFLLLGGLTALSKSAAQRLGIKVFGKYAGTRTAQAIIRGGGLVAAASARTITMPHRVGAGYLERRMPPMGYDLAGRLVVGEPQLSPAKAYLMSLGDVLVANFSEEMGPTLAKGAKGALGFVGRPAGQTLSKFPQAKGALSAVVNNLQRAWIKMGPGRTASDFAKRAFEKGGWHGLLEEFGEERLEDVLRATFNLGGEKGDLFERLMASTPSGEELLVESIVLSVPGAMRVAGGYAAKRLVGPLEKAVRPLPGAPVRAPQVSQAALAQAETPQQAAALSEALAKVQTVAAPVAPTVKPTPPTEVPAEASRAKVVPVPGKPIVPGGPRPRPAIFKSTESAHGKKYTHTAISLQQIIPAYTLQGPENILTAWRKSKDALGYVTYDETAKKTKMEVREIASNLKAVFTDNPSAVDFTVDRMDNNIAFKIKDASKFVSPTAQAVPAAPVVKPTPPAEVPVGAKKPWEIIREEAQRQQDRYDALHSEDETVPAGEDAPIVAELRTIADGLEMSFDPKGILGPQGAATMRRNSINALRQHSGEPWADAALAKLERAQPPEAAPAPVPAAVLAELERAAPAAKPVPPVAEKSVPQQPGSLQEQFSADEVGALSAKRFTEVMDAAVDATAETAGAAKHLSNLWRSIVTLPARIISKIPADNPLGVLRDHVASWLLPDYRRPPTWVARLRRRGGEVAEIKDIAARQARAYAAAMKKAGVRLDDPAINIQVEYVLRGEVDPKALPEPLRAWVEQMRALLDAESLGAAKTFRQLGMGNLAETYERNVGKYLKNIPLRSISPTAKIRAFLGRMVSPRLSRAWRKMKRDKWAVKVDGRVTKYETEEEAGAAYRLAVEEKKNALITKRGREKGVNAADLYRQAVRRVELISPIPVEWRIENEVHRPDYLTYQSIVQTRHDAVTARFFSYAARKWGVQAPAGPEASVERWARENGLARLPETNRLHNLKGVYVPKEIAEDLTELARVPSTAAKIYRTYLTAWKSAKVLYNPATHGRNIIGDFLFAYLARTSIWNPQNLPHYYTALSDLIGRRGDYSEAIRYGFIGTEYYGAELKSIEDSIIRLGDMTRLDQAIAGLRAVHKIAGNLYAAEDQIFKLAAYKIYKARGMRPTRAAAEVNQWFPNYARVGKLTKILRQLPFMGMPFASFVDQSIRIAARAVRDRPLRLASILAFPSVLSYLSVLLLKMSPEEKEIVDYDRSYWEPLLPWRDERGRVMTLDLRYIVPLANDIVPEQRSNAMLRIPWFMADPLGQAAVEQIVGRDMFTGRTFVPLGGEVSLKEVAKARGRQAVKTLGPYPTLLSYGLKRLKESGTGERDEPLARAILGTILGLNIRSPYINERHIRNVAKNSLEEGEEDLAETLLDMWNKTYKPPYRENLEIESIQKGLQVQKARKRTVTIKKAAELVLQGKTDEAEKILNDYNAKVKDEDYVIDMENVQEQAEEFRTRGKTK